MHRLERSIDLDVSCEELWDFIATPKNLNLLTPPDLEFEILSELPERMYDGLMILYRIRIPLFGRWRWLTEIKHIRDGVSFVDEQRVGPYRLWYHQHEIRPLGEGRTRMFDRVDYALPFGPLGVVVQRLWVAGMLEGIFEFRRKKLLELFPPRSQ